MMTSYNGGKFIRSQIESIIEQDFKNWELIIQDDGSTDNTLEIINEIIKTDSRISVYSNTGRHGVYNNFHSLINRCKEMNRFDYYMFSDHDDIWFPDKISRFISFCEGNGDDSKVPMLFYADMKIIDGNGIITGESLNKMLGISYKNATSVFFSHNVFGCNVFMNYALFKIVPPLDIDGSEICSMISHDNYYTKFAAVKGKIYYMDYPVMMYRRYGGNVTSQQSYSFGIGRIIKRILHLGQLAKDQAMPYNQSLYTINIIRKIPLEANELFMIEQIENSIKSGGIRAVYFFIKNKVSCGKMIKSFSRGLILFTGIYKKYLIF